MTRASNHFGVEYFRPVSDQVMQLTLGKLARIARLRLVVASGDRPKPVAGGSVRSLHMLGCAADLWMEGYGTAQQQLKDPAKALEMSKKIFDAARRHARAVFVPGYMYEVVLHGLCSQVNVHKGRKFGQPHCHIGRDPGSSLSAVQFKVEGVGGQLDAARAQYQQTSWVELSGGNKLLAVR